MSVLIVTISEITPWVFANEDAADHTVILDAASFNAARTLSVNTISEIENVAVLTDSSEEDGKTEISSNPEETSLVYKDADTLSNPANPAKNTAPSTDGRCEMLWPVPGDSRVVAGFPFYDSGAAHNGVDIFVIGPDGDTRDANGNSLSLGKSFLAARSGVVVEAFNDGEWNTGYGNYCIIDHGNGVQTLYAHANNVYVTVGDEVSLGQVIGEIGGTGNTTAPHLHFEVRQGNTSSYSRLDPMDFIEEP